MKGIRTILTVLLAAMLAIGIMSAPVLAAGTDRIKLVNTSNPTGDISGG